LFRHVVRIVWQSIGRAAPDKAMNVDIGQPREFRVPRVHTPDVGSERDLPATLVFRIVKVVVPFRVRAERGIVFFRRQGQWSAAAPTADQLRGDQLSLALGVPIRPQESVERADARLIFAETYIGAVAAEKVRLRHRQRHSGLTRISKDELTGLDWPSLTRKRVDATAFDRRLVDTLFINQWNEVAPFGAAVPHRPNPDARETLILLAGDSQRTA